MTEYIRVKTDEVEKLGFVGHAVITDGQIKSLEIYTDDTVFLITGDYSGLYVSKPKPDVLEDRWFVEGVVNETLVRSKLFDNEHEAQEHLNGYLGASGVHLEIKTVKYNVTEDWIEGGSDYSTF